MKRGKDFIKKRTFSNIHCSTISDHSWIDINNDDTVPKLHDMCGKKRFNCRKQIDFSPRQNMLEAGLYKSKLKNN